jgi:hypothetical protein
VNIAKNIAASLADPSGVACCRASVAILASTRVSNRAKLLIGGFFIADVTTPTNRQDQTSPPSPAPAPMLSSDAVLDALKLISRAFAIAKDNAAGIPRLTRGVRIAVRHAVNSRTWCSASFMKDERRRKSR